jgi:hypothetical protein
VTPSSACHDEDLAYAIAAIVRHLDDEHPWRRDALCREYTDQGYTWFPRQGGVDDALLAAAVCARCPVQVECFEYGAGEPFGIWGGTTKRRRRRTAAA